MLTVGTDSYVTLTEADEIVRLLSESPQAKDGWFNLSDSDKECKLRNACYRIESMRYLMYKHSIHQSLQFPRGTTATVPERVKQAQVLEAMQSLDTAAAKRRELQAQGVKSVSIGNTSESYSDGGSSASYGTLTSREAYTLLKPYLLGSAVMI